ncbi:MAG: hypothetical protein RR714_05225, partial [Aurantimicrobium sp.]
PSHGGNAGSNPAGVTIVKNPRHPAGVFAFFSKQIHSILTGSLEPLWMVLSPRGLKLVLSLF